MNIKKAFTGCVLSALLTTNAYAMEQPVAVGLNVSSSGLGIEARTPINDSLFVRGGFNYFVLDWKVKKISSKTDIKLLFAPLMLDWHPITQSGFRVSAGVGYFDHSLSSRSRNHTLTVDSKKYSVSEVGTISGGVGYSNKIAGVASFGYDSSLMQNNSISFSCEFGVIYAGPLKSDVKVSGTKATEINAKLKKSISGDLPSIYPIVSLGLKYSF